MSSEHRCRGLRRPPETLGHTLPDLMKISCQTRLSSDDLGDLEIHRSARSQAHKRLRGQRSKYQTHYSVDRSRCTPSPAPSRLTDSSAKFDQFCRRAGACDYALDMRAKWKTSLPSPAHELLSASPDNEPTSRTTKVFEEARRVALTGHYIAAGHGSAMLPNQDLVLRHRPLAAATRLKEQQLRPMSTCPQPAPFSRRLQDRGTLLVLRGLKAGTRESHLRNSFGEFGSNVKINLPRDNATRKPREFAFITFETVGDAQAAFDAMNGQKILWGHQRHAQSPLQQSNRKLTSSQWQTTESVGNTVTSWQTRSACHSPTYQFSGTPFDTISSVLGELSIPASPGVLAAPGSPALSTLGSGVLSAPGSPAAGLESTIEANFLKKMVELS